MLSYRIVLYCIEFELPAKSYIHCIDLHYIDSYYILPEGHLKTTTAKYSGVGGRGVAWEKQV
jgi:hypothetical protein